MIPISHVLVLSALLFTGMNVPPVGTPTLAGEAAVGELRSGARSSIGWAGPRGP